MSPVFSCIWTPRLNIILSSTVSSTLFLDGFQRTNSHIDRVKLYFCNGFWEAPWYIHYPPPSPWKISKKKGPLSPFYRWNYHDTHFPCLVEDTNTLGMKRPKIFWLPGILTRGCLACFTYMSSPILCTYLIFKR